MEQCHPECTTLFVSATKRKKRVLLRAFYLGLDWLSTMLIGLLLMRIVAHLGSKHTMLMGLLLMRIVARLRSKHMKSIGLLLFCTAVKRNCAAQVLKADTWSLQTTFSAYLK